MPGAAHSVEAVSRSGARDVPSRRVSRPSRTAVAAAALVLVATLAIGQERGLRDAARSTGQSTDSNGTRGPTAGAGRRAEFTGGRYELTGKVMVVDRASGRVAIDSHGKWLQLSVPTAHLAGIETGDRVTVSYELRD